jgi:hypothetical protein
MGPGWAMAPALHIAKVKFKREEAMPYTLSVILTIDGFLHVVVLIAILLFMVQLHRRHVV